MTVADFFLVLSLGGVMTLIRVRKLQESGFLSDDIVIAPPLAARFALCVVSFIKMMRYLIQGYLSNHIRYLHHTSLGRIP